jgi:hypothetical protein
MTKIVILSFKKGCLIKTHMFYIVAYEKKLLEKIKGKETAWKT